MLAVSSGETPTVTISQPPPGFQLSSLMCGIVSLIWRKPALHIKQHGPSTSRLFKKDFIFLLVISIFEGWGGKISQVSQPQNLIGSDSIQSSSVGWEVGVVKMRIHSAALQFPYSRRSWHEAIFDELFSSPPSCLISLAYENPTREVSGRSSGQFNQSSFTVNWKSVCISAAGAHIIFILTHFPASVVAFHFHKSHPCYTLLLWPKKKFFNNLAKHQVWLWARSY